MICLIFNAKTKGNPLIETLQIIIIQLIKYILLNNLQYLVHWQLKTKQENQKRLEWALLSSLLKWQTRAASTQTLL